MSTLDEAAETVDSLIQQIGDHTLKNRVRQYVERQLEDGVELIRVLMSLEPRIAKLIMRELPLLTGLEQLQDACESDEEGDAPILDLRGIGPSTLTKIIEALNPPTSASGSMLEAVSPRTLRERITSCYRPNMLARDLQSCVEPTADEMSRYDDIVDELYKPRFLPDGDIKLVER